jgi:hypothetical protein
VLIIISGSNNHKNLEAEFSVSSNGNDLGKKIDVETFRLGLPPALILQV